MSLLEQMDEGVKRLLNGRLQLLIGMLEELLDAVDTQAGKQNEVLPPSSKDVAETLGQDAGKGIKSKTQEQSFDKSYTKVDHLQRWFNSQATERLIKIITNKYHQKKTPLSILDLCCGYGLTTLTLRDRLVQNGVEIEKIVGYDVSEDMINFGQGRNEHYPQVDFKKKNIETEYDDIAQYDVAYCLFGLHWMSNIDHVVHCISLSLKPKGIFLSLTPIGNHELFEIRTAFVNNSKWTEALAVEARTLHRFHQSEEIYRSALSKYFKAIYDKKNDTKFQYTRKQFRDFLHSWLQEARHLTKDVSHEIKKEAIANAYINDLIDTIPKNLDGYLIARDDGSIIFTQQTYDFNGEKHGLEDDKVQV